MYREEYVVSALRKIEQTVERVIEIITAKPKAQLCKNEM